MIPIISLLMAVTLALLVTRVATVALTLTGMSRESARFQARSAFFGVGFTTTEAEQVVSHPVRRRIVHWLMVLGNAGLVTVISTLVLSFTGQLEGWTRVLIPLVLAAGLAILWGLATSSWVDHQLSRAIESAIRKWTKLDLRDYSSLLHLTAGFKIAEIRVESPHYMIGMSLAELDLKQRGMLVLGISRSTGAYEGAPRGTTRIEPGDILTVYGNEEEVVTCAHGPESSDSR